MSQETTLPAPGIYENIPEEEYRAWPAWSYSILSEVQNQDSCLAKAKYAIEHGRDKTAAMEEGSLFHTALLQPEILKSKYQILPEDMKVRRGKKWDELKQENPGVSFLTQHEYDGMFQDIMRMSAAVKENVFVKNIMRDAKFEVSAIANLSFIGPTGEELTIPLKCRCDILNENRRIIADPKKTTSALPRKFTNKAWEFGYYIQAALYTDIISQLKGEDYEFLFIVCEENPPYIVEVYNGHNTSEYAGQYLDIGRKSYQCAIAILIEAKETGIWPSYGMGEILDMEIPKWVN